MGRFMRWSIACLLMIMSINLNSVNLTENIEKSASNVRLAFHNQQFYELSGYYIAQIKEYYQKENISLEFIDLPDRNSVVDYVRTNKADFGISSSDIIKDFIQYKDIQVLASLMQHSPNIILSKKENSFLYLSDYVGKTINVNSRDLIELKSAFFKEGIDPSLVKFNIDSQSLDEVIFNHSDAIICSVIDAPYLMMRRGVQPSYIQMINYGVDFYNGVIFSNKDFIKKNPQIVNSFLKASFKGWEEALTNYDDSIDLLLNMPEIKQSNITKDFLKYQAMQIYHLIQPELIDFGHMNPARWNKIAQSYAFLNEIPLNYSLDGFIHNHSQNELKYKNFLRISIILIISISFIVLLFFLWNFRLRKMVSAQVSTIEITQKYLQNIFDSSPDAIFIHDGNTYELLDVNQSMCDMYRCTRDQVLSGDFDVLSLGDSPYDKVNAMRWMERAKTEGQQKFRWLAKRRDLTSFWVDISIRYADIGGQNKFVVLARDIDDRIKAENLIKDSEEKYRIMFTESLESYMIIDDEVIIDCNEALANTLKGERSLVIGQHPGKISPEFQPNGRSSIDLAKEMIEIAMLNGNHRFEWLHQRFDGNSVWVEVHLVKMTLNQKTVLFASWRDINERKQMELAMERRLIALTQPICNLDSIAFEDIFNINDIQKIQDDFAAATGVASVITKTDGTPITQPSNFTDLCKNIIRQSEKGRQNCFKSDSIIGKQCNNLNGPHIQACLSGGLWDCGAKIMVGGQHIANWLAGQVRDETQTEEQMILYAKEIDVDPEKYLEAFRKVPSMSSKQFENIAQMLYTMASQLSNLAYQNVQQARFITDRKKAEEALKESEQKLLSLFASMNEMVVLHELVFNENNEPVDYRITDCNIKYLKLVRKNKDHVVNQLASELYHSDPPPYLNEYVQVCNTGTPITFETYYQPYDKYFLVSVVSPSKNKFATITTDISSNKHSQQLIAAKNKELEQIVYVASHDLRSPLVNVDGYGKELEFSLKEIEAILQHKETDFSSKLLELIPDMKDSIIHIRNSTKQMDALLKGLLTLSRSGRASLNIYQLSMNELLEKIVSSFDYMIKKNEVKLIVEPLEPCFADEVQVNQLFTNLISNAFKFSDPSRTLEINISSELKGSFVEYCVSDNGIGIEKDHLEKIFELFYRLNPDKSEGEGLGLTIVRQIVNRLSGALRVESELGKGSKFFVSLPAYEELNNTIQN